MRCIVVALREMRPHFKRFLQTGCIGRKTMTIEVIKKNQSTAFLQCWIFLHKQSQGRNKQQITLSNQCTKNSGSVFAFNSLKAVKIRIFSGANT